MLLARNTRKHDRLLANTSMEIIREKMYQIHWGGQLLVIDEIHKYRPGTSDWDMPDGAKLPLWVLGFLY